LLCVSLSRKALVLSLKPENCNKTVIAPLERVDKTIYMGKNRARSLKRAEAALSERHENLPLATEKLPRGPYPLQMKNFA